MAQMPPLSSAVVVNENRLASSGTKGPRQPSSSPSAVAHALTTPTVAAIST